VSLDSAVASELSIVIDSSAVAWFTSDPSMFYTIGYSVILTHLQNILNQCYISIGRDINFRLALYGFVALNKSRMLKINKGVNVNVMLVLCLSRCIKRNRSQYHAMDIARTQRITNN